MENLASAVAENLLELNPSTFSCKEVLATHQSAFNPTRSIGNWEQAWRKLTDKAERV
jgi:hypothetical protein